MKRSYSKMMECNKIVLLGNSSIGKSTFYHKMVNLTDDDYTFPKQYNATDNFDFKRIKVSTNIGDVIIDLWDTAGQENRGGLLRDAYLKGADGVLLLYDVSNSDTTASIPKWLEQVKNICPNVPVSVIGNKSDTFINLQQSELVKLREVNLFRDVGHKKIKNFLISIKENTHLEFTSSFFSSTSNIKLVEGCMIGLEYVLSTLYGTNIVLKY